MSTLRSFQQLFKYRSCLKFPCTTYCYSKTQLSSSKSPLYLFPPAIARSIGSKTNPIRLSKPLSIPPICQRTRPFFVPFHRQFGSALYRSFVTMKAIQIKQHGGREVLEYTDVPKPTPGPGQLLVRNHAAGLNFIDVYHRTGLYPIELPAVIGREGAGEVVELGPQVEGFAVGDRVVYIGAASYAEYSAVNTKWAHKLPDAVDWEVGAAALLQGITAWSMVNISYPVRSGDWILVHAAAGGTGRWLVKLSKRLGAHVIATVSTQAKAELARADGADVVLFYSPEFEGESDKAIDERLQKAILEATGGLGVHAALDGVGKRTFDISLGSLRRLGTLVSFGNASGPVPPVDILRLGKGNYRLMRTSLFTYVTTHEEFVALAEPLFKAIADGEISVPICQRYSLADTTKAHDDIENRRTTGKIVLTIP